MSHRQQGTQTINMIQDIVVKYVDISLVVCVYNFIVRNMFVG